MKFKIWISMLCLGIVGGDIAQAQGAPIDPVDVNPPEAMITATIVDANGAAIADPQVGAWLPEPGEQRFIRFHRDGQEVQGLGNLTNVSSTNLHGICTNYEGENPDGDDFEVSLDSGNPVQLNLNSHDCAGAVTFNIEILDQAGAQVVATFQIPRDTNGNGIADVWEAAHGGELDPQGDQDSDLPPVHQEEPPPDLKVGDNIPTVHEYRGFLVDLEDQSQGVKVELNSGLHKHIRTSPNSKDVFGFVVEQQCPAPANGQTIRGLYGDIVTFMRGMNTLVPGQVIHLLRKDPGNSKRSDQWVDFYENYDYLNDRFSWEGTESPIEIPEDRTLNAFAEPEAGQGVLKGIRFVECLIDDSHPVMGWASWGTPTQNLGGPLVNQADNSRLYINRIANDLKEKITEGGPRTVQIFSFDRNGKWVPTEEYSTPSDAFIPLLKRLVEYYSAMEIAHTLVMRKEEIFGKKETYGVHNEPGHGSHLDQTFVQTIRGGAGSGENNFSIPINFNEVDQSEFRINDE